MKVEDIKPGYYVVSIKNRTFRKNLTDDELSDRIIYKNLAPLKLNPVCDVVCIGPHKLLCFKTIRSVDGKLICDNTTYVEIADIFIKSQEEINRENEKLRGDAKLAARTFKDLVDELQGQGFSRPEAINIAISLAIGTMYNK